MKKVLLLALAMLLMTAQASADTLLNGWVDRGIVPAEVEVNMSEDDVSPTTGRDLNEIDVPENANGLAASGCYTPFLVQIDNVDGGTGKNAPWGAKWADIVYESPLYLADKDTNAMETRISLLFSDVIPSSVGPVRSTRVGHAWLREEWDCGFVFDGQQNNEKASVQDVFNDYGAADKDVLFSASAKGREWKQLFSKRSGVQAPHNTSIALAQLTAYLPDAHEAANHTFLFMDEQPAQSKPAGTVTVSWNFPGYNSRLVYDEAVGGYVRFMLDADKNATPYADMDTNEALVFANVVVQHTVTEWPRADAPVTNVVGEGNADFFMGGVRVAGYWKRDTMDARTVYYDLSGDELQMQRGKTLIILLPEECAVSYAK